MWAAEGARRGAGFDEGRARRALRLGLGGFWLVDALLQAQPAMFTRALLAGVWQPVLQGQPAWLAGLITWSMRLALPHLGVFDGALALSQLLIGALLLWGSPGAARVGLWCSALFAAAVWVFGEGMGQLLAPGATLLSGAPGSTLIYLGASLLLLLPRGAWQPAGRRPAAAPALLGAGFLLLAGLLQLQPAFWTSLGLAGPFGQAFMAPQPQALRAVVGAASGVAAGAPLLWNAVLSAGLLGGGLLLGAGLGERHPVVVWGAIALLALVWLLGQDLGMLFSGLATDPNTAPALALLLWSDLAGRVARPAPHALPSLGGRAAG